MTETTVDMHQQRQDDMRTQQAETLSREHAKKQPITHAAILDHINLLALDSAEAKTRLVEAHYKLIEKNAAITALTARHDAAVAEVAQIVAWLRSMEGRYAKMMTPHMIAGAIAAGAHKEKTNDD